MIPIYLVGDYQPLRIDYLVVAGGGGGAPNIYIDGGSGGGGGAGGYISGVPGEQSGGPSTVLDPITFLGGQEILITVGAGGGATSNGSNSVFGSLTAIGGGYGANSEPQTSGSGGSGGGAPGDSGTRGTGTTNQGNDGGAGSTGANAPATWIAGGGGGAAEEGNTDSTPYGGDGLASSITGTSVFRAGGGGGSSAAASGGIPGGDGGGGIGRTGDLRFAPNTYATSGTVNTGGGGGGGGGNGGSGIVILRYPSKARIINRIDAGLVYTYSDDGTWKRYIFTSGSGNIIF